MRLLLWGILVAVLLAVVAAAFWKLALAPPEPADQPPPVVGELPAFTLEDRRGESFERQDLAGRPWVVDFIFTRCTASCPMITARMARLDRRLPADVGLLSLTVDPEHDTPEVLAAYAERHGASERWRFLTGPPETLSDLVRHGFRLGVDPATAQSAPGGEAILHSTRFVLVDGEGRVRGYYDALSGDEVARLRRDLAALRSP